MEAVLTGETRMFAAYGRIIFKGFPRKGCGYVYSNHVTEDSHRCFANTIENLLVL